MKKTLKFLKLAAFVTVVALTISAVPYFAANAYTAAAAAETAPGRTIEDYSDASGHWAEASLRQAVEDGILTGADGLLRPDEPLLYSEALTLICRVLSPLDDVPFTDIGLTGSEWYAPYASAAASMGLRFSTGMLATANITRLDAFTLLADSFQLTSANETLTALAAYDDVAAIYGHGRDALNALASGGYLAETSGSLRPDDIITRAEFIDVLCRVYGTISVGGARPQGNQVISGSVDLYDTKLTGTVWIDGESTVTLDNVTAETVVLRSQVSDVVMTRSTAIQRLVIAGGTSDSLVFAVPEGVSVGTLVLGNGGPKTVSVSGNVGAVEVTGANITLNVLSNVRAVRVSGSNDRVTVSGQTTDYFNRDTCSNNVAYLAQGATTLLLEGVSNNVVTDGRVENLLVGGVNSTVYGQGSAAALTVLSDKTYVAIPYDTYANNIDPGISSAVITFDVPELLPAGEELNATATVTTASRYACNAQWILDGTFLYEQQFTATPEGTQLTFNYAFTYTEDMALSHMLTLTIDYTDKYGAKTVQTAETIVNVQNYSYSYYEPVTAEYALSVVTTGYAGNYTLQWALEHDYTPAEKEVWINAKGYSSTTDYLVWINTACQRVNIFEGSAGNWRLIRTCIVGTGAPGTSTPVGVYTIFGRSSYGWTTGTYNVRPVVNFKVGSGYAFHSRLYNPSHSYLLSNPGIGYPISHGCVRMYDEDVQFIYDYIPNGTTVVVY